MSFFDSPIPEDRRAGAQGRVIAHFGSERYAALRALYHWLNLTLLLTFPWPALVTFFDAPSVRPENTPSDWFLLRLAAPVAAFLVAAHFWRSSGVPGDVAGPGHAIQLVSRGRLIGQIVLFLVGLSVVASIVLLLDDPTRATKALTLGLAEALAIQTLIAGYVKSTLETLDGKPVNIFALCLALFALSFAIRAGLAAGIQQDASGTLIAGGIIGGAAVGLLVGAVSLVLRDHTASLAPGVALQLLLVAIIPAFTAS